MYNIYLYKYAFQQKRLHISHNKKFKFMKYKNNIKYFLHTLLLILEISVKKENKNKHWFSLRCTITK